MSEVAAILLAAGFSRRMGARNKLLLPVGGVPMIRHMVNVYGAISERPVLVVTGHAAKDIEAALSGSFARTVFNPDYAQGQATSVVCGLREVDPATDVLIGLGDQPLLTVKDLHALLTMHRAADTSRISIPVYQQQRGNPIVVPASLCSHVLADPKSPGCKKFTRTHPEYVQFQTLPSRGFYTDIDTPEAYEALRQSNQEANV
ncbi:MAG: nucleotidyltransferase family protein [Roseobacter sp.]